jgi:energy-coupling factor transporter ATP-binding protein EcfA2
MKDKILKALKWLALGCAVFFLLISKIHWLVKLLVFGFAIWWKIVTNAESMFKKKNNNIVMFFGPPGAGKTTMAAMLADLRHSQGHTVLSNVDLAHTYKLDPVNDLGRYSTYFDGYGATVIVDEATLDFDGRNFKIFSDENKAYFSLFRHDSNEVFFFSQAVDVDKRIRDRAAAAYHLQRCPLLGRWGYICVRKIKKILIIEDHQKQLVDGYEFVPFSLRILKGKKYWHCFDTFDRALCCKTDRIWKPWRENELPDIVPASLQKEKETPKKTLYRGKNE